MSLVTLKLAVCGHYYLWDCFEISPLLGRGVGSVDQGGG